MFFNVFSATSILSDYSLDKVITWAYIAIACIIIYTGIILMGLYYNSIKSYYATFILLYTCLACYDLLYSSFILYYNYNNYNVDDVLYYMSIGILGSEGIIMTLLAIFLVIGIALLIIGVICVMVSNIFALFVKKS